MLRRAGERATMRGTSAAARASARVRLSCSSFLRSRGDRRKSTGRRTNAFAGSGLRVWLSVREPAERDRAGESERHERVSERPHLDRTHLDACSRGAGNRARRARSAERHELLDGAARSSPFQTKSRVGRSSKPPSPPTLISNDRSVPTISSGLGSAQADAMALSIGLGSVHRRLAGSRCGRCDGLRRRGRSGLAGRLRDRRGAVLVGNGANGELLLRGAAGPEACRSPAITKIMTALVVLEHAGPDEVVTVP